MPPKLPIIDGRAAGACKMLHILTEDENFLAINKPSGVHSALLGKYEESSIAQQLLDRDPSFHAASVSSRDAGLINRLDFETSGILIAAKTRRYWDALTALIKGGGISKSYLTLVQGKLEPISSRVYIGSPYRRGKKVRVSPTPKTRFLEAFSAFEPLGYSAEDSATYVEAQVRTGRRHQIRAHLSFLGHPLIGDRLYRSERLLHEISLLENRHGYSLPQFFLHAFRASFQDPANAGRKIEIEAPIPEPIAALEQLRGQELST
ncbi:MAG: RluA family pseudouridine synthase [Deltaproteobacteria bacterium]|nr:RluA family pseudouridine synthase [Deltaproteobacteria bacterium]